MSHRIMFLRDSKNQPVGCVAISNIKNESRLTYQVSVLNPHDKFDRKMARHLAIGRLVEMPIQVHLDEAHKKTMHEITTEVMYDLAASKLPTRAKKAAQMWLSKLNKKSDDQMHPDAF